MYEYNITKIIDVVDGDTIDVEIDLGFNITITERVRLAGIDAPELHSVNAEEKKLGNDAKAWLTTLLKDGSYKIRTEKESEMEKYGRLLGWLYKNDETDSVNNEMIKLGYAWAYDGGTKHKDFDALLKIRGIAV